MTEPHDQRALVSPAVVNHADHSSANDSFARAFGVPQQAAAPTDAIRASSTTTTGTGPTQISPRANASNAMQTESSTESDRPPPPKLTTPTESAPPSDAGTVRQTFAPTPDQPIHSQRACTQCQRHKIKCVSDGTGPCIRCRKKGFLCHIAPRKKRESKRNRASACFAHSPAGSSHDGRDMPNGAESQEDTIMDDIESRNTEDPQSARRTGAAIGGSGNAHLNLSGKGNLDVNADYGVDASCAESDGKIPSAASSSVDGNNSEIWPPQEAIGSTPSRPTPPVKVSCLPESMKQSTISSCENYTVYLSLTFLCPEVFRQMVDLGWQSNLMLGHSVNGTLPMVRSIDDSVTHSVFALSFQNEPTQIARYNLPSSLEAIQTVAEWRKQYGEVLIDVYFKIINPSQPIIHRRHFMAAYNANKESVILLLAIFAVSVPYCTLGTPDDRHTLQAKFIQHLYGHYSYKLSMPTMEAVQALSLIADSTADRGVLMTHAAVVAAAVELRLHMDCSEWNIPDWERALRKALWWSICIRDAWTIIRFVGTPKVMSEYYDTQLPTTTELSLLTMHESDGLYQAPCTIMVNGSRINISMESSLRSFISVAKLSEILLEVNRSLYQLKGLRFIRQQPAAAASHIAESMESRLQEVTASWIREESERGYELMEPDLYRAMMHHFVRLCIYSQFLPHKEVNIHPDRFLVDFYTRFLDATHGCIDTLKKFKTVKFSNYWPSWLNHLVIIHLFVLYDILIAIISRYFKTYRVEKNKADADEAARHDKHHPMRQAQRRALLLEILDKDRFSSRVLQYSTDLMVTMGDLAATWDQPHEIYKMMLKASRSFGLADVIDAPGMTQFMQQDVPDTAKSTGESSLKNPSQQQQRTTESTSQTAPQQQTTSAQYPTPQLSLSQAVPLNDAQQQQPTRAHMQPQPLHSQPTQSATTSSQTLLPPVYQLPTVGPLQNMINPSLQSLMVSPSQPPQHPPHPTQPGLQQTHPSCYDIAQILNQEQPQVQATEQSAGYGNNSSTASQQQPSAAPTLQPQNSSFVGPFGSRMQQNFYADAAGTTNTSADSGVHNSPLPGGNVPGVGGVQAIGAFDDFFTNLSINLFEGLADFHPDFIL
ncbi:fungal-specific transcription factor domain-containing protein [Lipomyces orientalis]|uniref:Fungal-specific transcription factor domain-containing protein n=1 Tax=Lipomyces orientalis TaxID=1233043 RepID=A0ACC3TJT2_9ASCO